MGRQTKQAAQQPVTGACHCGKVQIALPYAPQVVTNCNCSLCRRYGGLWGYYKVGEVKVTGQEHTQAYIWGDRMLATHRCRDCGCITHWTPIESHPEARMGVNIRNFDPVLAGDVTIRCFDGADSWTFVDCA
jgi:hypothetical protein